MKLLSIALVVSTVYAQDAVPSGSTFPSAKPSGSSLPSVVPSDAPVEATSAPIVVTPAPVTPAPVAPLPTPCPDIPDGGCSVCGDGMCVTNPDAVFAFPGQPEAPCGVLEDAGEAGTIPLDQCPFLPTFIQELCDCQSSIPPPPTMAPTDAPVADPTGAPVVPPTDAPVDPPTGAPVVPPSMAPEPTDAPVEPVDPPTPAPIDMAPVVVPAPIAPSQPVAPPAPVGGQPPVAPAPVGGPSSKSMKMKSKKGKGEKVSMTRITGPVLPQFRRLRRSIGGVRGY